MKMNIAILVFMFNTVCVGGSLASLVKHKAVFDDSHCTHAQVTGGERAPGVANICVVLSRMVAISHRRLLNT